ncbi:MAG: class I SAM-dependent methyltransferase [Rhodospirillales bacterium]|nr:class I SAM-dependent methyltransferase [Rhodospirillales bacterium]
MSFYARHVLPRVLDLVMRSHLTTPYRERVAGAAEGRVLEIGIGSGLNLAHYGAAVREVIGIDPSAELLAIAHRRAAGRAVTLLEGSAETLPLADASVDTVVTTWTLCTVPDAARALAEMRRVLRPGGSLLFVEHGRSPAPAVARWQDRLDRPWGCIAGGCHLNRRIDALVAASGLRIARLEQRPAGGPPTHSWFYEGRAVRA